MSTSAILLVILVVLLIGGLVPLASSRPPYGPVGYGGGVGLLLALLPILLLLGRL